MHLVSCGGHSRIWFSSLVVVTIQYGSCVWWCPFYIDKVVTIKYGPQLFWFSLTHNSSYMWWPPSGTRLMFSGGHHIDYDSFLCGGLLPDTADSTLLSVFHLNFRFSFSSLFNGFFALSPLLGKQILLVDIINLLCLT